ncbi:MAG: hypothetical protein Q9188_004966 [Gyalolechia gomerana]
MIKLTRTIADQALKPRPELQLVGNQAWKDTLRIWVEAVEALRLRAEGWQMKLRHLHGAIKSLERDSDSDEDMHALYEVFDEAFESSFNDVTDEDIEEGADEYYYGSLARDSEGRL